MCLSFIQSKSKRFSFDGFWRFITNVDGHIISTGWHSLSSFVLIPWSGPSNIFSCSLMLLWHDLKITIYLNFGMFAAHQVNSFSQIFTGCQIHWMDMLLLVLLLQLENWRSFSLKKRHVKFNFNSDWIRKLLSVMVIAMILIHRRAMLLAVLMTVNPLILFFYFSFSYH